MWLITKLYYWNSVTQVMAAQSNVIVFKIVSIRMSISIITRSMRMQLSTVERLVSVSIHCCDIEGKSSFHSPTYLVSLFLLYTKTFSWILQLQEVFQSFVKVSIGGTASFFTGFCVLGAIEILYFLSIRLFWHVLGKKIQPTESIS